MTKVIKLKFFCLLFCGNLKLNYMEKYNGREVKKEINFLANGTFQAYYNACDWCKKNGYSYGSMDRDNPIAMWHDYSIISKWHNLSTEEKNSCDAVMIGEFREGDVSILIFNL